MGPLIETKFAEIVPQSLARTEIVQLKDNIL